MTPDRIRGWLKRTPAGAERLQLCYETKAGPQVLCDWTRSEIEAMEADEHSEDLADLITSQSQEHADAAGVACKFPLRWLGSNDRALRNTNHHAKPTPIEEEDPLGAARAEVEASPMSPSSGPWAEAMVKELCRALLDKDRALNEAYKTSLEANEKTIGMLQAQSELSFKLVGELRTQVADMAPTELSSEQKEETLQRAKAWEKLIDMMPDAGELLINAVASKLLPEDTPSEDPPEQPSGSGNGHAARA